MWLVGQRPLMRGGRQDDFGRVTEEQQRWSSSTSVNTNFVRVKPAERMCVVPVVLHSRTKRIVIPFHPPMLLVDTSQSL